MKQGAIKVTLYAVTALVLHCFCCCGGDPARSPLPVESGTRGVMEIEVTATAGDAADKMETIRFLVFNNVPTTPELELNRLFQIPDTGPGEDEVSRLRVTLEVSKKLIGPSDKMVVAIVNEPPSISGALDAVASYDRLINLELDLDEILDDGHNELRQGCLMPMTGVIWTDRVHSTPAGAEGDPATIAVQRALARVEVYMRKEAGQDFDLAPGSTLTLDKTYDREYLVRDADGSHTFGLLQTVTSGFISKSRTVGVADDKDLPGDDTSGRLVCTFYTPERTCNATGDTDKLLLDLNLVTSEGAVRTGRLLFDRFSLAGSDTDIEVIERNNNYRVITTIGSNGITASVTDWNTEDIETEF